MYGYHEQRSRLQIAHLRREEVIYDELNGSEALRMPRSGY